MPLLLHQPIVHALQQLAAVLERHRGAPEEDAPVERRRAREQNPIPNNGVGVPAAVSTAAAGGEVDGGAGGEAEGGGQEVERGRGGEGSDEVVEEVIKRGLHPELRPPSAEPRAPAQKGQILKGEERVSEIDRR